MPKLNILNIQKKQKVTTSSDEMSLDDMKMSPSHNGRDRDAERHLDSLSMSSVSSACSALSWDGSPSLSCRTLKKEPEDLEEDEAHEVCLLLLNRVKTVNIIHGLYIYFDVVILFYVN